MSLPESDDLTLTVDPANGVIHLKAAGAFGDPVELSADDARELARQLLRLTDELE